MFHLQDISNALNTSVIVYLSLAVIIWDKFDKHRATMTVLLIVQSCYKTLWIVHSNIMQKMTDEVEKAEKYYQGGRIDWKACSFESGGCVWTRLV